MEAGNASIKELEKQSSWHMGYPKKERIKEETGPQCPRARSPGGIKT